MEFDLRCNNLRCRSKLTEGEAYVTCCSHIFCSSCASRAFNVSLTCPTCETSLTEAADIILVELNPTDNWKSMILCGHRPETLMEICSRAISFWVYQVYQELVFKDMVQRDSDSTRQNKELHLNSTIAQLKSELSHIKEKISVLAKDYECERRKCFEISEQLTEKTRQVKKLQMVCDKLRKKAVLGQVATQMEHASGAGGAGGMARDGTMGRRALADQQNLMRPATTSTPNLTGFDARNYSYSNPATAMGGYGKIKTPHYPFLSPSNLAGNASPSSSSNVKSVESDPSANRNRRYSSNRQALKVNQSYHAGVDTSRNSLFLSASPKRYQGFGRSATSLDLHHHHHQQQQHNSRSFQVDSPAWPSLSHHHSTR